MEGFTGLKLPSKEVQEYLHNDDENSKLYVEVLDDVEDFLVGLNNDDLSQNIKNIEDDAQKD